jgi:hypothetical protein
VVQVGFAGSRRLLDAAADTEPRRAEIQHHLSEQLGRLGTDLRLTKAHFLCGVSSLAIGADTLFTLACQEWKIPQRILLPQPREEFLHAKGSDGTPDFSEDQRAHALTLLDSPHVIHEEVVSHAADRPDRFEDVNLEIVKLSDVIVCLLCADAKPKPGGTQHLLDLAKKRELPTLEIRVALRDGKLHFTDTWHNLKADYQPPQLPAELAEVQTGRPGDPAGLPSVQEYCAALKTFTSQEARGRRKLFRHAVVLILFTHFSATVLATVVLAFHTSHAPAQPAPGGGAGEYCGETQQPGWLVGRPGGGGVTHLCERMKERSRQGATPGRARAWHREDSFTVTERCERIPLPLWKTTPTGASPSHLGKPLSGGTGGGRSRRNVSRTDGAAAPRRRPGAVPQAVAEVAFTAAKWEIYLPVCRGGC